MAGSTFYGTTLTDLQGGRTAQDRMDAERQQLGTRLFAQAAQGAAERMAANQRAQQDRAYQMLGLERQDRQAALDRALKTQELKDRAAAELARIKAEEARTAAILEAERIRNEGLKTQFPAGRINPQAQTEILRQNTQVEEYNLAADASADEANNLLLQTMREAQSKGQDSAKPLTGVRDLGLWGGGMIFGGSQEKRDLTRNRAIDQTYADTIAKLRTEIPAKLGERAALIRWDNAARRFVPITRTPMQFPGLGIPATSQPTLPQSVDGEESNPDVAPINRSFPGVAPSVPRTNAVPTYQFNNKGQLIPKKVGASITYGTPPIAYLDGDVIVPFVEDVTDPQMFRGPAVAPDIDPYLDIQRRNQYFASLY